MRSSRPLKTCSRLASIAAFLLVATPAAAESVKVDVIVSHASSQKGPMEQPNLLPPGFNFQSHEVLSSKTLTLDMGQTGTERLPNGKQLKLRPDELRNDQLRMHVEVQGATKSDLSMRNGKRVTIRHPEPYQGGNLLVHLEAHF